MGDREIFDFIIIGGGISGINCAETLSLLDSSYKILLISSSLLLKKICNFFKLTKYIESFEVGEQNIHDYLKTHPNIGVVNEKAHFIDSLHKLVTTNSNEYSYTKSVCIAIGGHPSTLGSPTLAKYIYTLRDLDSVSALQNVLLKSKNIMIVGNGGIATELIYKIKNCQIYWVIKDSSITKKFLSDGASEYLLKYIIKSCKDVVDISHQDIVETDISSTDLSDQSSSTLYGSALGPNWHLNYELKGGESNDKNIILIKNVEVSSLIKEGDGVEVHLTNGQCYQCDFIISATGVIPNSGLVDFYPELRLNEKDSGSIIVDAHMRTSSPGVFAVGDVCGVEMEEWAPNWFQMRLWDQAYHMGYLAALNMSHEASESKEPPPTDFYFELFAHTTHFFGQRVILLGLYNPTLNTINGLTYGEDRFTGIKFQKLVRVEGDNYVEVILSPSRSNESLKNVCKFKEIASGKVSPLYVRGAILIGNTDMEEVIENLILNQMDVSSFGDDLLNPNIDISDFFD